MKKLLTAIVLTAYSSPTNRHGKSPLDIPQRTIIWTFLIALFIALTSGNITLFFLYDRAEKQLNTSSYRLNTPVEKSTKDKIKAILPENYQIENSALTEDLDALFKDSCINSLDYFKYLGLKLNKSPESIKKDALGSLSQIPLTILDAPANDLLLLGYGFQKPSSKSNTKLSSKELDYYLGIIIFSHFRRGLSGMGDISNPHRLLRLIGGTIQWLTFIAFIWAMILLVLRIGMCELQRQMILTGASPVNQNVNIWQIKEADVQKKLGFYDVLQQFPKSFLPISIIEANAKRAKQPEANVKIDDFIAEQVAILRGKVEGEFELLNFLSYVIPSLGFIGTVLGIIAAMDSAVLILLEKDSQLQANAMSTITGFLAVAFDTTFVALLLNIIVSFVLAMVRNREHHLFEVLENESVKNLRDVWKTNRDYEEVNNLKDNLQTNKKS